jgi:hypothetical protein
MSTKFFVHHQKFFAIGVQLPKGFEQIAFGWGIN